MWRSVVESLVRQHGYLVLDALWNSHPVKADDSVGDVVTEPQVVNEPYSRIEHQLDAYVSLEAHPTYCLESAVAVLWTDPPL